MSKQNRKLTVILILELLIVNPPSLRVCDQRMLVTQVRSGFSLHEAWRKEASVVDQVAEDEWLVDGEPDVHAVAVERVDHSGVVGEPVGNKRVGPST